MNLQDLVGAIVAILVFLMIAGQNLLRFQNRGQRRLEELEEQEIEENEELIAVEKRVVGKPTPRTIRVEGRRPVAIKKILPVKSEISLGRKALYSLPSLKRAVIIKALLDPPKSYD